MDATRREFFAAAAAAGAANAQGGAALDGPTIAHRHPFVRMQATPDFFEGLLLGNGDLQVCLTVRPDALGLHFGKSDVWDLRVSEDHIAHLLPFPQFLALWERASEEAKRQGKPEMTYLERNIKEFREYTEKMESSYRKPWPRPWPCGTIWLHWDSRMVHVVRQTLDPSTGLVRIELEHDNLRGEVRPFEITCFVSADEDHLCLASKGDAPILSVVYYPHAEKTAPLPPAELSSAGMSGGVILECFQVLPVTAPDAVQPQSGPHPKDGSFTLAAKLSGKWSVDAGKDRIEAKAPGAQPLRLDVVLLAHQSGARERASRISGTAEDLLRRGAARWWTKFWSQSAVEIDDEFHERLWYQNQYLLACCLRPGETAPGLFASWSYGNIGTAWHGDYHLNYNTQQIYWGVFSSNHAEQHLPYVDMVERLFPMAQWNAKHMFGLPGAYYPHSAYPVPSTVNPYPAPPWGYEICETPWTVQSLWWHYLYTLDLDYLRRVYPLMKAAADFLTVYVKKGDDGKYHIIPSVSPENYGHTVDFRLNRDCIIDLALTRFLLGAMVEASTALGVDHALRKRWAEVRENMAAYPTGEGPFGRVWLDVADGPLEWVYNVPVTLAPVFPADQVGLGRGHEQMEVALRTARTVRLEGGNDLVWQPLARARLGVLDLEWFKDEVAYNLLPNGTAYDRLRQIGGRYQDSTDYDYMERMGVWIENLALPAVLNECLMQSWAGYIALFPNTTNLPAARFRRLRAQGAFLVSAEWDGRSVVSPVTVESEKGALCRILAPWGDATKVAGADSQARNGILEFATKAGASYRLERD